MRRRDIRAALTALMLGTATIGAAACQPAAPADQRGVTSWSLDRDGYGTNAMVEDLRGIKGVGASWVTFVPAWYVDRKESVDVHPVEGVTPSDESLTFAIDQAHSLGLKVFLQPHMDTRDGTWRGAIRPSNQGQWYSSYTRFVEHYASLAQRVGVEQFSVGLEMKTMQTDTAAWRDIVAAARKKYAGPITYGANHDSFETVEFWDRLDLIGVNAYFPLSGQPTNDVATLQRAWNPIVDRIEAESKRWGNKPVVLAEVGYASAQYNVNTPWEPYPGPPDASQQVNAYTALLNSFEDEPWFRGVHWWHWNYIGGAVRTDDFPLEGKPVAETLRQRWSARS